MNRRFWVNLHLYLAAFFAPMLLIVAMSGGLYLLGIKGNVEKTEVPITKTVRLDLSSSTLEADVRLLLKEVGVQHDFEYVKLGERKVFTRPTSRASYEIKVSRGKERVSLTKIVPDLQKSMIELHKGHGPILFKQLQKVMALGLLTILLSGLYLGVTSKTLKIPTLLSAAAGLLVFIVFGLLV
jgi:uncharacterized iron-regulated membrane protein